ncbi:MAG: hypothetical protein LBG62_05150 [Candidatus Methanoplasma sp.]|nr:hypothetical protein [Candidatus Methanoplasma sp.]
MVSAALAIRLLFAPTLAYDFDIWGWGTVIQNMDSGNDLYQVAGYYYTPVWGYIVGSMTVFQDLMGPDLWGVRSEALLGMEGLAWPYHTANTMSTGFLVFIKIPLIACDMAVAYLIHWLVRDRTGDGRKAVFAVALWLMCPIAVYMSGIQAQFDTVSALFMLLTAIAFYKDRCLLGGALLSAAILLKFFPFFCILVILAYVWGRHRRDGAHIKKVATAITGMAAMGAILILPQILNGTLMDAFSFALARAGASVNVLVTISNWGGAAVALLGMIYFALRMARHEGEDRDSSYFENLLLALAAAVFVSLTPQYVIVMLPLLILRLATHERRMIVPWALISVGSFMNALALNNFSLFTSAAEFLGLVSPEWALAGMQSMDATFLGVMAFIWIAGIAIFLECIGLLAIFAIVFRKAGAPAKRPPWRKVWRSGAEGSDEV